MATTVFYSTIDPVLKNDGTINAGGTIEFYEPATAFATPKAVYGAASLSPSLGAIITLDASGTLACYLSGNYDIKIKDSDNVLLRTAYDLNPTFSLDTIDPNLIMNSSFENGDLSNWTLFEWNTGTTVVDTLDPSHGTYGIRFTTAGSGGGYVTSNLFAVSPQRPLEAAFNIKSSIATVRNIVQMLWYDENQAALSSTTLYDDDTSNPLSWTAFAYSTTPPAGAYWAAVKIVGGDSSNLTAGTIRYDGIRVFENLFDLTDSTISGDKTFTGDVLVSGTTTHSGTVNMTSKALNEAQASVAAATTTNILGTDANSILLTGGSPIVITSFGTSTQAGAKRHVTSTGAGAHTLTHNGTSLILPGSANITVAQGDTWWVEDLGSNNCRVYNYEKATGAPIKIASFGAWDTSKVVGTDYLAASDLVVHAVAGMLTGFFVQLSGYTDAASTPTTLRVANDVSYGTDLCSITMLVRAGDYWRVDAGTDGTMTTAIHVIALG